MNPTKDNRLKIFSFLAILEIIFLNPISIAAGVVALVHAANSNASYKSKRWNDFEKQRKNAGIALLVGLIGVILQIGIIICLHLSAQLDRIDKASEVYYRFALEGNEISLPMSVEELENAGLYFTEDVSGYQLNPGGREMLGCVTDSYRDQNFDLAYVTVINPTNELISLKDGIVVGINIQNIPKMEGLKISFTEINLMEGVNFNTSERELLKLYGKPDDKYGDDTANYTQYVWHQEGYEENYYNLILFDYMNGQMMSVSIQHKPVTEQKEEQNVVKGQEEVDKPDDQYESVKENSETVQYPLLITPKSTKTIEFAIESEDIFCIYNGENYGYIKMDGQEITDYIYDMAYPFSEGVACVLLDGKYGFIDDKGEIILPFVYDDAAPFSDGLAYYAKDGEYGFIKKDGTVAFQFECDSVSSFQEDLAYFSLDGKYGYIDPYGRVAIEAIYDDADYFKDGLARVILDGYVGLINCEGEEVVSFVYDKITWDKDCIVAQIGDKKTQYSLDGKIIFIEEAEHYEIDNSINGMVYDNLTAIPEKDLYIVKKEGFYGVVDSENNVKVPFEYDLIGMFVNGYAFVYKDGKYGIIAENGDLLVPIEYESIRVFEDGSVSLKKEGVIRLYNKEGDLIYSGNYDYITPHNGYYELENDTSITFIDMQGKEIFSTECDYSGNYIYGDYKNYVLSQYSSKKQEQLLIIEENDDVDLSEVLLKNSITPRIKLYWDLIHGNQKVSIINQEGSTVEVEKFITWDDWSYIKKFHLYDINNSGKPILYTFEEPCINLNFPMSDSAFYDIKDNQLHTLITGYECGGSMRGDYVCLWRDNEKGDVLIGTWGAAGGFGGYANYSYIYQYYDGNVECIADFNCVSQDIRNYDEQELNQKAELFYSEDCVPCTKDNIFENEYLDAYYFNDELVTVEEYTSEATRFTKLYIP